jgi:hypothetical protein
MWESEFLLKILYRASSNPELIRYQYRENHDADSPQPSSSTRSDTKDTFQSPTPTSSQSKRSPQNRLVSEDTTISELESIFQRFNLNSPIVLAENITYLRRHPIVTASIAKSASKPFIWAQPGVQRDTIGAGYVFDPLPKLPIFEYLMAVVKQVHNESQDGSISHSGGKRKQVAPYTYFKVQVNQNFIGKIKNTDFTIKKEEEKLYIKFDGRDPTYDNLQLLGTLES